MQIKNDASFLQVQQKIYHLLNWIREPNLGYCILIYYGHFMLLLLGNQLPELISRDEHLYFEIITFGPTYYCHLGSVCLPTNLPMSRTPKS